ncbi:MAG: hypothetical protein KF835_10690 [Xanthobacteraceae bacterium]|nr:hypothetical protein [Xanthobacteraceae bacterium]
MTDETRKVFATLLVAAVIALVFGIPLGAFLQIFSSKQQIDWAAWFQAIFSILGIAIAIYVPWRIHQREREEKAHEQKLQAHGIALLLKPELITLKGALERRLKSQEITGTVLLPTGLKESLDRLYLLGPAGGELLVAASIIMAEPSLPEGYVFPQHAGKLFRLHKERMQIALDSVNSALSKLDDVLATGKSLQR